MKSHVISVPAAEALLQLISEYLMDIGVRSMEVRMRIQQKSSSNKRAFASDWEEDAKRFKVSSFSFSSMDMLILYVRPNKTFNSRISFSVLWT